VGILVDLGGRPFDDIMREPRARVPVEVDVDNPHLVCRVGPRNAVADLAPRDPVTPADGVDPARPARVVGPPKRSRPAGAGSDPPFILRTRPVQATHLS
jgi:hypothetical protein